MRGSFWGYKNKDYNNIKGFTEDKLIGELKEETDEKISLLYNFTTGAGVINIKSNFIEGNDYYADSSTINKRIVTYIREIVTYSLVHKDEYIHLPFAMMSPPIVTEVVLEKIKIPRYFNDNLLREISNMVSSGAFAEGSNSIYSFKFSMSNDFIKNFSPYMMIEIINNKNEYHKNEYHKIIDFFIKYKINYGFEIKLKLTILCQKWSDDMIIL